MKMLAKNQKSVPAVPVVPKTFIRIAENLKEAPAFHEYFLKGQSLALSKMKLEHLVQDKFTDAELENIALLGMYENARLVGGIKIHFKNNGYSLPAERILEKFPESSVFQARISAFKKGGIAELCSLWVSREARGRLLSTQIITYASDFAFAQGCDTALGFIGPAIKSSLRAGFVLDEEVEPVPYPDERFLTKVVWRFKQPTDSITNLVAIKTSK